MRTAAVVGVGAQHAAPLQTGSPPPATGRRPVAVLLSRFPLITETFILREVIEMERQGQPVRLVPLLHERPRVVHREALAWMGRTLYAPLLSAAVLAANLRALRRRPAQVLRLLARLAAANLASPNFLLRTLALFPKSVWAAERLEAENVGHLHAHFATHPATMAWIVSSLTGIPWSMTVHAHDIFVRRAMLRDKLAAARFVRAVSRFNREFLEERYPGEIADRSRVVHVGIDPQAYRRLPSPPDAAAGPPRILCVAALKPYKGLPVLIDACRLLADGGAVFRCDIVGEGPLRPELERRIAGLGLAGIVSLLGAQPQHEVARLLGASSVFVLPSIVAPDGQMEGIPVSLMEAMAAGRPVVASALSGIPELVEDGVSGLLVPPGNAAAVASALGRLLADPALGLRLGERGRETVEREFRLDAAVTDLLGLIAPHSLPADPGVADLLGRVGLAGAGARRVHRRMDSMVIEALVPDPTGRPHRAAPTLAPSDDLPREIVVKVQRSRAGESRPAPERARREFAVLSRLHERFTEDLGFGVPRPLRLVEEEAAVLMERCRGTALDEIVRRGRAARGPAWRELTAALRQAGTWLRLFQLHTGAVGDAGPAVEALLGRTAADLDACRQRRLLTDSWARRVEARLGRLRRGIGLAGLRLAGRHGDFWPGNLYIETESVQAIDFEGYGEGLAAEDAACFLVHLEPFFAWPGLGRRRERAAAAFLQGWLDGAPLDRAALDLCRIAEALQVLARMERGGWRERRRRRVLVSILRRAGRER